MVVFKAPKSRSFHRSRTCTSLTHRATKVYEVSVEDAKAHPCRTCFPEQPERVKLRKTYCTICQSRKPCGHNGGVLRYSEVAVTRHTLTSGPGDTYLKGTWVWPDSPLLVHDLLKI